MEEEVDEVEDVVVETAEVTKTTKSAPRPSSRRTIIMLSFGVGVLLLGFVGYWFLHYWKMGEASPKEVRTEPQSDHLMEVPPHQEPQLAVVPDTFATDHEGKTSLFAAYRDSLNRITDTLQGVFVSHGCEPTCFAWFDVKHPDGKEPRAFYCPFSTVSGYPLNRLPKDGASWTLITQETAIGTEVVVGIGRWPVVYEIIELRRGGELVPAQANPTAPTDKVYHLEDVNHAPTYRAGVNALWAYLATRRYTDPEKSSGITGTVLVNFVVDRKGRVRDVSIDYDQSSDHGNFIEEAKRLVRAMDGWYPGEKNGMDVSVHMTVPVDFGPE